MRPYLETPGIRLYQGDCRDVLAWLARVAPGSVDVVVADPPYGQTSLAWDVPVHDWLGLLAPLLRPSASLWCFGSLRMFLGHASAFTAAGWRLAQDLVWEKHNGSSFHADRFRRVHEQIAQFYPAHTPWAQVYKRPVTTPDAAARTVRRTGRPAHTGQIGAAVYVSVDGGPRLARSVLKVRSCHGRADHPTQKPLGVVTPLLEYSCPPAGLVLDPFAGSGTTLVAAQLLGCRAVGVELDAGYCQAARRRLAQQPLPWPTGEAPR